MTNLSTEIKIDETLKLLLANTKRKDEESKFDIDFARTILGPLYHYEMKAIDVMRVLWRAHQELIAEPRFQTSYRADNQYIFQLMVSPVEDVRLKSRSFMYVSGDEMISLTQLLDSYAKFILNDIYLSNVGWCRNVIWPEREPVYLAEPQGNT